MTQFLLALILLAGLNTHGSETMKGAQKDYETFKSEMSAKMDALDKEFDELKHKTKTKGHAIKEETIKDLEATKDDLRAKMSQLKDDSKESWKSMKKKLSEGADSLHSKLQKALED